MSDVLKFVDKGEKLLQRRRVPEAMKEFEAALAERPDDEALLFQIVDTLVAASLNTQAATLLGQRFDTYAAAKRAQQALDLFRRLVALQQQQPATRLMVYAGLLETMRQPRDAENVYRQAAVRFRSMGLGQQELAAWRSVLRLNPNDRPTCVEIASRAEALRDNELAGEACSAAAWLSNEDPSLLERACRYLPQKAEVAGRYARALLKAGNAAAALEKLQPFAADPNQNPLLAVAFADALLANGQPDKAREIITPNIDRDAEWYSRGLLCLRALARAGSSDMNRLAAELERHANAERRNAWSSMLDELLGEATDERVLAFLADAFERAGKDEKLVRSLLQTADFAIASGNFQRAAELLERAVGIDPYVPGATDRLQALRGHIDQARWDRINKILGGGISSGGGESEAVAPPTDQPSVGESTSLDDLILQAELFLNYRVMDQAKERVQVLAKLFPGEEADNARLAYLYEATGVPKKPKVQPAPPPSPPAAIPTVTASAGGAAAAAAPAPAPYDSEALGIAQISQTARALHREASASRIFFAAVNHVGRLFRADRCLSVKFSSDQVVSRVAEYCAPGIAAADRSALGRLMDLLEAQQTTGMKPLILPRTNEADSTNHILDGLGIKTLLSHPLEEAGRVIGVIVLAACSTDRSWSVREDEVLGALADQLVLALGSARLRALVRQLTVSDDRTGLLQVSSMLELMVAECAQALEQRSPLSLMVIELVRSAPADYSTPEMIAWLDRVAQKMIAYLRPNDAVARLKATRLLVLLPDTIASNCAAVLQKLRHVFSEFAWPDAHPLQLAAGAAQIAPDVALPGNSEQKLQPEDAACDLLDRSLRAGELHLKNPASPMQVVAPSALAVVQKGTVVRRT